MGKGPVKENGCLVCWKCSYQDFSHVLSQTLSVYCFHPTAIKNGPTQNVRVIAREPEGEVETPKWCPVLKSRSRAAKRGWKTRRNNREALNG